MDHEQKKERKFKVQQLLGNGNVTTVGSVIVMRVIRLLRELEFQL